MGFNNHVTPSQRKRAFISMLIMIPMTGAATDIYIPSLPAMAQVFDAERFAIQSTFLVFMVCYGFSQIIVGPLTDCYGRRWPILLGSLCFVLASVGIAMAPPLWAVITLRGLQGIFAASCAVGARAIIVDCYIGDEQAKAANWLLIVWAIGTVLSPALGGYLQALFGWSGSFWFLAAWGSIAVLIALFFLPETRDSKLCGKFLATFGLYGKMIADPVYLSAALAMACIVTVMYGFEALGPFYVQVDLHQGPVFYGHMQMILGCLWVAGIFFNRFIGTRIKAIRSMTIAAGIALFVSLLMLILDLSGVFSIVALMVPAGIINFMVATIWPNTYSKCLGRFPEAGGTANALFTGLFVVVSGIVTALATLATTATAWPMWLLYTIVCALTLFFIVRYLRKEFDYKLR